MQSLGGENARALYGANQFRRPSMRTGEEAIPIGRSRRKTGVGTLQASPKVWAAEDEDEDDDKQAATTPPKKEGSSTTVSPANNDGWSPASTARSPVSNAAATPSLPPVPIPEEKPNEEIITVVDAGDQRPADDCSDEESGDEVAEELQDTEWPYLMTLMESAGPSEDSSSHAAGWAPPLRLDKQDMSTEDKARALLPPMLCPSVKVYSKPNFGSGGGAGASEFPSSATITIGVPLGTSAASARPSLSSDEHSHLPVPLRPIPVTLSSWSPALDSQRALVDGKKGGGLGGFSLSATASSAFCLGFGAALKRLRATVSKKKRRFQQDGFDLDLTMITPRIIAMGFPSSGGEGLYRNPLPEVQKFFESRHRGHYRIYNLCSERAYDPADFCGRVARYAFDDHNPCPLEMIPAFCADVHAWLGAHPANVAAIHCKAGKGRTGLMIAAYLLHSGVRRTAEASLRYFGVKRTKDMQGVTIPSQMRMVHYYERMLACGAPPVYSYRLKWVRMRTVPNAEQSSSASNKGGCVPYFTLSDMNVHSVLLQAPPPQGAAAGSSSTGSATVAGAEPPSTDVVEGWCGTGGKVIFDWRVAQATLSDLLGRHGSEVASSVVPLTASSSAGAVSGEATSAGGAGGQAPSTSTAVADAAHHHHHGPTTTSRPAFTITNPALTQPLTLRKYKAHEPFVDFDCSLFNVVVKGNTKITFYHEKAGLLARAKGAVKGAKSSAKSSGGGGRRSRSGSMFQALTGTSSAASSTAEGGSAAEPAVAGAGAGASGVVGTDDAPPLIVDEGPSSTVQAAKLRPSSNLCHIWFHTGFITKDYLYFPKHVIDKACKEKKGIFSPHFGVELYFERLPLQGE
jgi:C2 domain of PTEN tumour-suppressor protein